DERRRVVLVRPFTEADDVAGFHPPPGSLTSEGGRAAHAAPGARGVGKPGGGGAGGLATALEAGGGRVCGGGLPGGAHIVIDVTSGAITTDQVALVDPQMSDRFKRVLGWADAARKLRVRTNADTPEAARQAREFGAEGIGLCRTEHMFMSEDRVPKMQAVILA